MSLTRRKFLSLLGIAPLIPLAAKLPILPVEEPKFKWVRGKTFDFCDHWHEVIEDQCSNPALDEFVARCARDANREKDKILILAALGKPYKMKRFG